MWARYAVNDRSFLKAKMMISSRAGEDKKGSKGGAPLNLACEGEKVTPSLAKGLKTLSLTPAQSC